MPKQSIALYVWTFKIPQIRFCNKNKHTFIFIFFLEVLERSEGERERKRNMDIRETHWSVISHMRLWPGRGFNLVISSWVGIEPMTLRCKCRCSNHGATLARVNHTFLLKTVRELIWHISVHSYLWSIYIYILCITNQLKYIFVIWNNV